MDYRDEKFVSATAITMEINHPVLGWIPFTAAQDDVEVRGRDLFAAASATAAPYVAPEPDPPTAEQVNAERDRRIDRGFVFGGNLYQSRPEDQENISGASVAALSAIMSGATAGNYLWHGGASPFVWIAADNSEHQMDAHTMFAFGQAAMAHKQAHIFAARAIKDADPIPADYTDDSYWP